MKTMTYRYPDCEHDGDVDFAQQVVESALSDVGSSGRVTFVEWSGYDGDDAIVTFTIEDDKVEAFFFAIENYI